MTKKGILRFFISVLASLFTLISCDKEEIISYEDKNEQANTIKDNGHNYVDLGLSVYWATCNIGANSSTDQGNKYAFGETIAKSDYTSSNYIGGNADVAKQSWGGDWRLPTKDELKDLVDKCSWKITTKNGAQVTTATGPNGNSIDLPYYSYIQNEGYQGWYWSSTSYSSSKAYCLHFDSNTVCDGTNNKYLGFLARAVMTIPNYAGDSTGGEDGGKENGTTTYEKPDVGFYDFTATKTSLKVQYKIYNKDEAKVTSAKIYYGTSSNPTQSATTTVSGVMISANISGLKAGTEYYVKCVATGKAGTTTTTVTKCITNYDY